MAAPNGEAPVAGFCPLAGQVFTLEVSQHLLSCRVREAASFYPKGIWVRIRLLELCVMKVDKFAKISGQAGPLNGGLSETRPGYACGIYVLTKSAHG